MNRIHMMIGKCPGGGRRGTRQGGFTLVELLVTLSMAAILLAVAVPSFRELIQSNRLTSNTNRLLTSMMLARSEAVKRGRTIVVSEKAGDWANGWNVTDGAVVLRDEEALDSSLTLTKGGGGNPGSATYQFDADGTLDMGNPVETLTLCDSTETGETGRSIILTEIGQVSSVRTACP